MAIDMPTFVEKFKHTLNVLYDRQSASQMCTDLIKELCVSDKSIPIKEAESVLQLLRNKRMFNEMQKLVDALLQTGRITYKIQRQYAQALIELGHYTAAISVLQGILANTNNSSPDFGVVTENKEAKGLLGRVYKQLYVNAQNPNSSQSVHFLLLSANIYYEVYKNDKRNLWHGINAVAVLERARRDKVEIPLEIDGRQLATEILQAVQTRCDNKKADAWDFAIAAEACVALEKPVEALEWLSGYARMKKCDAFELASTLRQLEQVWQLDLNSEMGQLLIPLLRSELVKRDGGKVTLSIEEIKLQQENKTTIDETYKKLKDETVTAPDEGEEQGLEKVFGEDSYQTYTWYMDGASRCLSVARIGRNKYTGVGTGFLLKGKDLEESLGEELVLLTNNHVVSSEGVFDSLTPDEATVTFQALASKELTGLKIIWSSPVKNLDATVLRFTSDDQNYLKTLTAGIIFYPVSGNLPPLSSPPKRKVYAIGHPLGKELTISLQDNLLIDYDEVSKLHYRTPTRKGSSGSPIFNENWQLIALHHAGSQTMRYLKGKEGTHEANEGIWIQAIKKQMKEDFSKGTGAS